MTDAVQRANALDEPIATSIPSIQVLTGTALVACVVFFNEANFRSVDVENFSVDWQIGLRLTVCALCGLFGCALLPQTSSYFRTTSGVLTVLFAGWAVLTIPFALNPIYSIAAVAALWCFVLVAPAMLYTLGHERFLQATLFALACYLVGSWFIYFAFPDLGRLEDVDGMIRLGGLNHPNTTGRQSALTIALGLTAGLGGAVRWRYLLPLLMFALLTLFLTDSRTAACAAIGAGMIIVLRKIDHASVYLLGYLAVVAVVFWIAFAPPEVTRIFSTFSRSGDAEEIVTLTGRTDLWRFALGKLAESPVFGYGYGGSRFVIADHYWTTHHAHNVVLNTMLGTGLVGGCLLLAMFWRLLQGALLSADYFPDVILALVAIGGIADAVMLSPVPDSHTLMWLAALAWRVVPARSRGTD